MLNLFSCKEERGVSPLYAETPRSLYHTKMKRSASLTISDFPSVCSPHSPSQD